MSKAHGHPDAITGVGDIEPQGPSRGPSYVTRRAFLERSGVLAAAAALLAHPPFRSLAFAQAAPDHTLEALNGLAAFVVPGPDDYSIQQGQSTPEPGGVAANTGPVLRISLDAGGPAPPPFPTLSDLVAASLDGVAAAVNPAPTGPFSSLFANLSFDEKVAVFSVMESGTAGEGLVPLAGTLMVLTSYIAYSEAGVTDPATGELLATPVGWSLSGYGGVSNGHDDYQGYFQHRRRARRGGL